VSDFAVVIAAVVAVVIAAVVAIIAVELHCKSFLEVSLFVDE